jgi:hypothetical protein
MKEKILNWYQTEIQKDNQDLKREKDEFIKKIKKIKKDELINQTPKKLTLWERIKKVLTNT